jgi:hypothetical protein
MKQRKILLLLFVVFAVACIGSCKKMANTVPGSTSISFKFNGSSIVKFQNTSGIYATNSTEFELSAGNTSSSIQLNMGPNFTSGTFDIASGKATIIYTGPIISGAAAGSNVYRATSGTVVITSYSTTAVSGTFAFTGTSLSGTTCTVDSGKFITGYTSTTTIPVSY